MTCEEFQRMTNMPISEVGITMALMARDHYKACAACRKQLNREVAEKKRKRAEETK